MLLGGRTGDLFGRRAMFIAGLALFTAASLAGGLATSQGWLLAARAVQGAGAAVVAPAALALITTTFPAGPQRNRAFGVYAAMAAAGGAVGLIAGGLLTSYVSWRWVLFVNVPIGALVTLLAPRTLAESPRRRGRLDLPGVITGTGGVAALVCGLASAAPSGANGTSHWGDAKVIAALTGATAALAAFAVIEVRGRHPLLPVRLLADRSRTGANLAMLCTGAALLGMFFFLTLFLQVVWGYSALRAGLAYLPMTAAIGVTSGVAAQLVPRAGALPTLLTGSLASAAACTGCPGCPSTAATCTRSSAPPWSPAPASACCSSRSPWSPWPRSPSPNPGWPPACVTPASRSAGRSAWPCSVPSPSPSSRTAPAPPPPPDAVRGPPSSARRPDPRSRITR
jgi:MFS family permease